MRTRVTSGAQEQEGHRLGSCDIDGSINGRVLYVEDDADTRDLVLIWLNLQGFHVTTVATAAEALPLIKLRLLMS